MVAMQDHQSDEPDSMRITCTARSPLKSFQMVRLISEKKSFNNELGQLANTSSWFVSYPINNYNVLYVLLITFTLVIII